MNGLSRMRGDPHVRFLGGGGAVRRCCYPTAWHNQTRGKPAHPLRMTWSDHSCVCYADLGIGAPSIPSCNQIPALSRHCNAIE
jgi:hypothetical protein